MKFNDDLAPEDMRRMQEMCLIPTAHTNDSQAI